MNFGINLFKEFNKELKVIDDSGKYHVFEISNHIMNNYILRILKIKNVGKTIWLDEDICIEIVCMRRENRKYGNQCESVQL